MDSERKHYQKRADSTTGAIKIPVFDGKQIVSCSSVECKELLLPLKNEPKYVLTGIDRSRLFPRSVILGWYDSREMMKKEYEEIFCAMEEKRDVYELKHYTEVEYTGAFGIAERKET